MPRANSERVEKASPGVGFRALPCAAMSIYLIRHGETDGNRTRTVQVPSTPLSEKGLHQASLLALRCRDLALGVVGEAIG